MEVGYMVYGKRTLLCVIALCGWLASAAAGADSVLRRLEQAIGSSGAQPPAETPAPGTPKPSEHRGAAAGRATSDASDDAKQLVQSQSGGGYLGAVADDTNDRGRGVRVIDVRPGSPAEKAGLKPLDLITGVAGTRVRELSDMASILSLFAPGDTIALDIRRGEQAQQIKVTLGVRPGGPAQRAVSPVVPQVEVLPTPPSEPSGAPPEQAPEGPMLEAPKLLPPANPVGQPAATPSPPSHAVDISELKELIVELRQRIENLEARIARLEKALADSDHKQ